MIEDNINEWILNLDNKKFNILLEEIIDKKKYYSQKIVEIWDKNYTLKQIKKILKIFSVLDKVTITFAVIKNEKDDYKILNNTKNKYIENPDFKEFLENETNEREWYLIPNELEDDIINIIGKISSDKELLKELLNETQHKEVVDFISDYSLEEIFLDKLNSLNFDTTKKYNKDCFEYKVLDLALTIDNLDINLVRDKIRFDNEPLNSSLISSYITFKYGKVTNPIGYDNKISKEVSEFIDKVDNKYKQFFDLKEENKEDVYDFIKNEIYNKNYLNNQINTKNRLKFILYYSLEQNTNYFNDFKGVSIYNDDSYGVTYKLLKDIGENVLQEAPFEISDFFPNNLKQLYYIQDKEYAIQKEYLPDSFENRYIKVFKIIGLEVDDNLVEIRKKLLNNEVIDIETLGKIGPEKIVNSIEFLASKEKIYKIDSDEIKVLQNLFKVLNDNSKIKSKFLPYLINNSSIKLKQMSSIKKDCILHSILRSSNKLFQKRLSQEIEEKDIIYLNILNLENIPSDWYEIEENKDEKIDNEKQQLDKQEKNIKATLQDQDENSDGYRWMIGWKGEKYIYEKLTKKFDIDKIVWHNKNAKSIQDDRGGIDIEIKDSNNKTIHNIEIKTTIKSTSKDKSVSFTLSSKQFEAATDWGRDTHLIFVTGIEDDEPKVLYMNFDNNWLI
jgi:hypothetical protein